MALTPLKKDAEKILALAGITIDGPSPWDIHVHDERFYSRVMAGGSLALGESYMDGWWDAEALDEFFTKILLAALDTKIQHKLGVVVQHLRSRILNLQHPKRAYTIGEKHYDAGNDLYERMLDKRLTYTCGYWANAKTLDDAQDAKLDLVCKKIDLQKGDRVLDIGCGWGSFAGFAAERYGAHVVGITVSREQIQYATTRYTHLPVEFHFEDYRKMHGRFDHIVSLGMFEHVGYKNYRTFMEVARRCLKSNGLLLLHTIGCNYSKTTFDPWIEKYIFPNSMLPSIAQIAKASEKLFVMEDWHNLSTDYDTTLMHWHKNFEAHWNEIASQYNERFHCMWRYYLLISAAAFRARMNQLWQIVLSPTGVAGGYKSIR